MVTLSLMILKKVKEKKYTFFKKKRCFMPSNFLNVDSNLLLCYLVEHRYMQNLIFFFNIIIFKYVLNTQN